MQFTVTENAFKRIEELLQLNHPSGKALRISVDGGGCAGYKYNYEFDTRINEDDFIVEKNGIKVIIDPVSQQFMANCMLDFVEQLGSSYFEIRNPAAASKCGCGNSFSV